jgi:hypothetical protein
VESLWPFRLALAASISRSTSRSVRCSRVRNSAFGRRRGVTVRFSLVGDTSRSFDFAIEIRSRAGLLFVEYTIYGQCSMKIRRSSHITATAAGARRPPNAHSQSPEFYENQGIFSKRATFKSKGDIYRA